MIMFRWIVLRLFWSLLLLLPLAFVALWILHEYLFPDQYLSDPMLVLVMWLLLLPLVSAVLTREGRRRLAMLEELGRSLLERGREEAMPEVFARVQQVWHSGLLSTAQQAKLQRRLLRSYFPFHAAHPERRDSREQLLAALRSGVRTEEAYQVLRTYVLNQPALTFALTNLAEELLDHRPEDDALVTFMVQHFLAQQKSHYRAEYFYTHHLSRGGPLVPGILELCLEKVLRAQRQDDFAAWCCVRAFALPAGQDPRVRHAVYHIHRQRARRQEALAQHLETCAAQITPQEAAGWLQVREPPRRVSRLTLASRLEFAARQLFWEGVTYVRVHRRWALAGALATMMVGMIYLVWSRPPAPQPVPPAPAAAEADTLRHFSLQVAAVKNKRSAEAIVAALQARSLEVYMLEPQAAQGFFKIRLGKYRTMRQARAVADSLKAAGVIQDYYVTNYDRR